MTHFDLVNMTKVTLGHLINTLGYKNVYNPEPVVDELIVKHAIKLAKEVCIQLDAEKPVEETGE